MAKNKMHYLWAISNRLDAIDLEDKWQIILQKSYMTGCLKGHRM